MMRQPVMHRAGRPLSLVFAALVLAGTALSGLLVAPPDARAALVATGVPDSVTVKHDRTLVVAPAGVLANDLNLLGDTTAILVSGVSNGELDLDADGGFTYEPAPGFVGTDSFRYRPSGLLSTAAKVTISVTNATPVARPDSYTWPGGTLSVSAPGVLANDTDADGDALVAELDGGGISGSFDLDENGGFRYTPGGGFSGTGTVRYRVWDGVAWSATTTITLTLQAPTPTPTPTPKPTPRPTPTPTPTPILPLPSLPLPSLPLPLPSIGASPTTAPTTKPTDDRPRSSASPSDESSDEDAAASAPPGSSGVPGAPGSASSPGFGPASGDDPSLGGGSVAEGDGLQTPRLVYDRDRLDLETGAFGILAGFQVWAVPAATVGVPGILVLLWVALQAGGGLAWIPAVRRLRGSERRAVG